MRQIFATHHHHHHHLTTPNVVCRSQTTTASQSKSNLYDQPVEHFPVAPTATTEPEEAAVPVTAAIDSAYDSLQEMMIGPSNGNEGTPPRQMASSQHVRRALAHQAVADGDFSVQVSNARGEVSFSAYPAPGHDDSLWGGLELAEEHAEDRPAAAADDVASS